MAAGVLYIVATPIGNLEDITLRALRVLKEVDVIAAEDTRHSRKLLTHYNISKPIISYWREKEKPRAEDVIRRLKAGQDVALISDAGTPGVSDPGAVLIKMAIDEGIHIIPIPGPSALIAALSVSGLLTDNFVFMGFLPLKEKRRKTIDDLRFDERTLIFYEAPHRLLKTLSDISEILGERRIALVKELTKLYEEVRRGSISDILNELEMDAAETVSQGRHSRIQGEYVIVVEGRPEEERHSESDALLEIGALMKKGLGRKEAVKRVAAEYGLSKKELYDRSLTKSVVEKL